MPKRVCVIGAGPSGIASVKSCLEEGLHPVCYEQTSSFGGLWRFRENDEEGVASVMKSTITNSCKELTSYSDFPAPSYFPNYMHNSLMVEYMRLYCENFKLNPYFHYNKKVIEVKNAKDFKFTGRWIVKVQDEDRSVFEEIFDAVMICIGHHVYPHSPQFPGLDLFKGNVLHTHAYKTPKGFEDARILVIGIGNSGGDAAVELSRIGKKVYLSTRRGAWVYSRINENGKPLDLVLTTRAKQMFMKAIPFCLLNSIYEKKLNERFDHEEYRLKPNHRVFAQPFMMNDDLPSRIMSGTLIIKDDIDHFSETGVVFKDSPKEYRIDAVIMATGYKISFPFISDDIIDIDENKVSLYKYVFPPQFQHPTLAVIGLIQPAGAIVPLSEMQARWVTRVFKGEVQLPSESDMKLDIRKKRRKLEQQFAASPRNTIQVDYMGYMDEIGALFGAKPKLWLLLLKNPHLFFLCIFGPDYPYQYRLNGPHSWPGAVDAILTADKRMSVPLHTRPLPAKSDGKHQFLSMLLNIGAFIGLTLLSLKLIGVPVKEIASAKISLVRLYLGL